MTYLEVDFVLTSIQDHYDATLSNVPLERVDGNNAYNLDQDHRRVAEALERTNIVTATFTGRNTAPIGSEYDHDLEATVNVEIEGAHHTEHGHIDKDGANGVAWETLVENIRRAILTDRKFPSVGRSNVGYKDLFIENEPDTSGEFGDYFQYNFDVTFRGFEDLP